VLVYGVNDNFLGNNQNKNLLQLQQLRSALNLARSSAILQKTTVYLCPSQRQIGCGFNWTNNILIMRDDQVILYALSPIFSDKLLRFRFFGNQSEQKITFLPNGFTFNNGHFCTTGGVHCLYINQSGKIYIQSKQI
jgi:Tfp pilus assembly protein FimT